MAFCDDDLWWLAMAIYFLLCVERSPRQPDTNPSFGDTAPTGQAARICTSGFRAEWDPMITTLPGLYAIAHLMLAETLGEAYCTVAMLRAVNAGTQLQK